MNIKFSMVLVVASVFMGAVSGYLLARYAIANAGQSFDVKHQNWYFSSSVGTQASSMLERARIAESGPLALSSSEVAYFLATNDKSGQPLSSRCSYVIKGSEIDSRWWSITLYDGSTRNYVNPNQGRASYTSTSLRHNKEWQISLLAEKSKPESNVLILPKENVPLELLLRIYRPAEELRKQIPYISLPVVEKLSCD